MTRSLEQNAIFHAWCGLIALHLRNQDVPASADMVKELVLLKLGNTSMLLGEKVAMRSSKYKMTERELTVEDHKRGFICFVDLLTKIEAWAATDLQLDLVRTVA